MNTVSDSGTDPMELAEESLLSPLSAFKKACAVAAAFHGQVCRPLLVRRWRSGKIVWEGPPDTARVLHRPYWASAAHKAIWFVKKK